MREKKKMQNKKIVIHQPCFFPYIGNFHKFSMADVFVIMDETQYDQRFTNRNKIINPNGHSGWDWLTIPINKGYKFLPNNQVEINNEIEWQKKHWKKILFVYKNAEKFDYIKEFLLTTYTKKWDSLFELDFETMKKTLEMLEIKLEVVKESELDISTKSTNRLVDICKKLDGTTYISGNGSRNYIDNTLFKKQNIELIFQNYLPKEYKQISSKKFIPNLSIIDLLVNFGSDSKKFVNEEFLNYN